MRDMLDIRGRAQFRYCYYLLPSIKEYSTDNYALKAFTRQALIQRTVSKIIIQEANQVTLAAFTAGTILGIASFSLLVLGSLFLFQKAEQKRYRSNPKYSPEDYIDTTIKYIDDDEECYILYIYIISLFITQTYLFTTSFYITLLNLPNGLKTHFKTLSE